MLDACRFKVASDLAHKFPGTSFTQSCSHVPNLSCNCHIQSARKLSNSSDVQHHEKQAEREAISQRGTANREQLRELLASRRGRTLV